MKALPEESKYRLVAFILIAGSLLLLAATCNRMTFPDMMDIPRHDTPIRVQSYLLPDGRRLYCVQIYMNGSLTLTCDWQNAK